jgi:hypothetical protein
MKTIHKTAFVIISVVALGGCASPNILIQPTLPGPATPPASGNPGTVWLVVDGTETSPQAGKYEEKGAWTPVGKSESLGVHLSDIWMEEPPPVFVKRMLENNLKAWGYKVISSNDRVQLHGHVNKFSLNSKAISALELQADGVIDVDLELTPANAAPLFKGHYVGTCTHRSATAIPNKENMEKLFSGCVEKFQKQLEEDTKLRAALSSN